jgi:hypothetical protein
MSKLFLLSLLFLNINLYGQALSDNDLQLLIGKELKVIGDEEELRHIGDRFYFDEKLDRVFKDNSNYASLAGKVFKVISLKQYTKSVVYHNAKLKLENPEIGILYFDYFTGLMDSFPFEIIGGLGYPEGSLCKEIEEFKDKFTNEITYRSPASEGITFIKVKKGNNVSTYLSIRIDGSTLNFNEKGVILLLNNKLKIIKPEEKLDVEVNTRTNEYDYIYSAFIRLNTNDLKLLTQNIITDVRLYIYDKTIINGAKTKEYLKCIIKK